ncbi:thiol:disulfide interchange protein DsbD [Flavobacterium nitrogenifigens]|uniref:Thiol:disulfide interchange protein DsbD n=2 Tax=Flavobacterium TaxID=237 RepID=A0A7W7N7Q5_9FLAO|nr:MULTISPECIES: thioredoxin family protein [Flavobacterium]MBB4801572.1 thiol:disulfide interchange protein DsbD [Flavobacterium nitrogenifigens]MBB6386529.1 thiol:disulfide interchange protein DsbD [Flavobacterium notoginsengisoli]
MKKNIFLLGFFLLFSIFVKAQIYNPIKWVTHVENISENEYELQAKAIIEPGWHLYSQSVLDGGPIPTRFSFVKSSECEFFGAVKEEKGKMVNDPVFKMQIKFFEKETTFKQRIKISSLKLFKIKAEVEYMVCNDENCLPPTFDELEFTVKPFASEEKNKVQNEHKSEAVPDLVVEEKSDSVVSKSEEATAKFVKPNIKKVVPKEKSRSLWTIFLLSFFSGFAALLTPCVFPMIPMTVSFFTKQSKSKSQGIRKAIFYGIAIIAIYIFLGAIVTWAFGADSLNALSTNVWFNLIFFVLLMIFAFSFLGAFEIMLPNAWANKVDSQADKGGIVGILFMALALAIVSFSCTGPIVGTLLVEAASRGGIAPFVGMFGFSLALALPFTLFAAFPGWLNSLPKSGGWLNSVKVFLGFLEMALAFKFLSNADLVLQLHWLEREAFLAIWIAIFGTLTFYLFGKIQLPHDSPVSNISVPRLGLGVVVLAFTIYLIPGIWGAPLKMISGFPPPMHYSELPNGLNNSSSKEMAQNLPEGAELGPHNIMAFTDYDLGMQYAKKIGKPVMIDFTGHACVNCRKMEDNVWSDEKIQKILKGDLVLISLYVDDKRELNPKEQITSKLTGKKLKYIGQKWSEFQTITYKTNAQPFYVLVNHNGETLNETSAYNPDIKEYLNWLQKGVSNFEKSS